MAVLWDNEDARVVLHFQGKYRAYIHCRIFQNPMAVIRKLRELKPSWARLVKAIGYQRMYAYIEAANDMAVRHAKMWGFEECGRNEMWVLLRQEA